LSDTPSAIILSKEGVVEFVYRKKNAFPFIGLKKDQAMPSKSLSQRFSGITNVAGAPGTEMSR
jgi:hypothetical protein